MILQVTTTWLFFIHSYIHICWLHPSLLRMLKSSPKSTHPIVLRGEITLLPFLTFFPGWGWSRSLNIWIDIFILYERGRVTHISIFTNTDTLMWNWRHGTRVFISWNKYLMTCELTRNLTIYPVCEGYFTHKPSMCCCPLSEAIYWERIKDRIKDGWSLKHRSQQSSSLCMNPHSADWFLAHLLFVDAVVCRVLSVIKEGWRI